MNWQKKGLFWALLISSGVSVGLFVARMSGSASTRYSFLVWNLFLAWVPLGLALLLKKRLALTSWSTSINILVTLLWLGFLPNSFYIVSDFVHLKATGEVSIFYDAAMMTSFAFNGIVLGYMSLYIMHRQIYKRIKAVDAHIVAAAVLLLCSFAIYLGRYLRWNTWDVLVNPAGLLFDVSDRLVNPVAHPQTFTTTITLFVLLGSMYLVSWNLVGFLRKDK